MDMKKFMDEYRKQRSPANAFLASLTEGDVKKLEDTANQLQAQYVDALQHAATVGIIESIASESPYAAVAMLESMTLAEPTKRAAYLAVARRTERGLDGRSSYTNAYTSAIRDGKTPQEAREIAMNIAKHSELEGDSRVNSLLRMYCLQQAGMDTGTPDVKKGEA